MHYYNFVVCGVADEKVSTKYYSTIYLVVGDMLILVFACLREVWMMTDNFAAAVWSMSCYSDFF